MHNGLATLIILPFATAPYSLLIPKITRATSISQNNKNGFSTFPLQTRPGTHFKTQNVIAAVNYNMKWHLQQFHIEQRATIFSKLKRHANTNQTANQHCCHI